MKGKTIKLSAILIALVFIGSGFAFAASGEAPEEEWSKTFGRAECYDDTGRSVQQTKDGGYIIAGYTWPWGADTDVWLIKTDSKRNEEWSKIFGGPDGDYGYSVQQTSDGGYIIAGYTASYGAGGDDVWLIKTDSKGNEQWNKTFGGSKDDKGYSVQQTKDGGYIITGETYSYGGGKSDIWLIKTDSEGNKVWDKTFGGSDSDYGYSVQQTKDGGYIIAGGAEEKRPSLFYDIFWWDVYLIKTDSNGNKQWDKTFDESIYDKGYSVQQTKDGGYIITGYTDSYDDDKEVWLIKTDSKGNKEWDKTFGCSKDDVGYSVQQTKDGGYIITGNTHFYGDYNAQLSREYLVLSDAKNVYLIKTDSKGNEEWSKSFSGTYKGKSFPSADEGYSVQQTSDGGYIIAGYCDRSGLDGKDVWLIKVKGE